jgi:hypothetical protein
MVAPASGPLLFDTSAESWLARSHDAAVRGWFRDYLSIHRVHVSAVTVVERIRDMPFCRTARSRTGGKQ